MKKAILIILLVGILLIPISIGVFIYSWLTPETKEQCKERVEREKEVALKALQDSYEGGGMVSGDYYAGKRDIRARYKFSCK